MIYKNGKDFNLGAEHPLIELGCTPPPNWEGELELGASTGPIANRHIL